VPDNPTLIAALTVCAERPAGRSLTGLILLAALNGWCRTTCTRSTSSTDQKRTESGKTAAEMDRLNNKYGLSTLPGDHADRFSAPTRIAFHTIQNCFSCVRPWPRWLFSCSSKPAGHLRANVFCLNMIQLRIVSTQVATVMKQ